MKPYTRKQMLETPYVGTLSEQVARRSGLLRWLYFHIGDARKIMRAQIRETKKMNAWLRKNRP